MDNRIFNVNGSGKDLLLMALRVAFMQEGHEATARSWVINREHGLGLCWARDHTGGTPFFTPISAGDALPMVWNWLEADDDAKAMKCEGTDADADHDGHNARGWRVHFGDAEGAASSYAICFVRPAFMWHGK